MHGIVEAARNTGSSTCCRGKDRPAHRAARLPGRARRGRPGSGSKRESRVTFVTGTWPRPAPDNSPTRGSISAITSDELSSLNDFLPNLRTAVVARTLRGRRACGTLRRRPPVGSGIERDARNHRGGEGRQPRGHRGRSVHRGSYSPGRMGSRHCVRRHPSGSDRSSRGTWRIASDDEWGFEAVLTLEGPHEPT